MPKNINQEILSRGVEEVFVFKHLAEKLKQRKLLRVKFGIDPTGPNIHLGRAVPLLKLRALQSLGHTVVLVIGDFTAQIGDPSDKLDKRPLLTKQQVENNLKSYKKQLSKILDTDKVEWHFNSRWLSKLNLQEFSKLAEAFTVQQMLSRRNFKERYNKNQEISLREFIYPLLQGYDSVKVKADLEIGGADQLFNLQAGRLLQPLYGQLSQDILTTQMLEGTDGRKMSTSWGNTINITESPQEMYGQAMSIKDELLPKYLLLTTNLPLVEVEFLIKQLTSNINPKTIKQKLAWQLVSFYHSIKQADAAAKEFDVVHRQKLTPNQIPTKPLPKQKDWSVVDLLFSFKLVSSKNEAKRLIEQGGVKVNKQTIINWQQIIKLEANLLLQVGKRKFLTFK
ncbi:tyrosine--tRNA ligase [Patescibacteria group bacterium]|nr:tyrosine--tRNA ligase [Patescibacteria group bacterium]